MRSIFELRFDRHLDAPEFDAAAQNLQSIVEQAGGRNVQVVQADRALVATFDYDPEGGGETSGGVETAVTSAATFLANALRAMWAAIPAGTPRTIVAALGLVGIAWTGSEVIVGTQRIILGAQLQRRMETILNSDSLSDETKQALLIEAIEKAQAPESFFSQITKVVVIGAGATAGVLALSHVLQTRKK